jgi:transposase
MENVGETKGQPLLHCHVATLSSGIQAMSTVEERLERIESMLETLVGQQTVREWYSTEQVAQILGKAEFTVREWARQARIVASKRRSGRGAHASWAISHTELLRLQREGLLPIRQEKGR